jgi:hypothetical protein
MARSAASVACRHYISIETQRSCRVVGNCREDGTAAKCHLSLAAVLERAPEARFTSGDLRSGVHG